MIWILIVGWIGGGVLAAGYCYSYFQAAYPSIAKRQRFSDALYSWALVLLGFVFLLALWLAPGCAESHRFGHGWKFPGTVLKETKE